MTNIFPLTVALYAAVFILAALAARVVLNAARPRWMAPSWLAKISEIAVILTMAQSMTSGAFRIALRIIE